MALIPKVEPKQEKKVVSARLDEEAHTMLQRYAAFLGGATHEYIIGESLKRLFRRDKEFNEWLEKNHAGSTASSDARRLASATPKNTGRTAPTAA
jgi:hypothetical protein